MPTVLRRLLTFVAILVENRQGETSQRYSRHLEAGEKSLWFATVKVVSCGYPVGDSCYLHKVLLWAGTKPFEPVP